MLAFGAGLTRWTTRDGALIARGAKVVQVDLDEESLGAHRPGPRRGRRRRRRDRRGAARRRRRPTAGFRDHARARAARSPAGSWRDAPFEDAGDASHLDPRALTIALDAMLPAERTVAVDSGHFMGFPPMYLRVPDAAGLRLHAGVPVDRARPRERHRRGDRAPRPAHRRVPRRRRRADVAARARDARAPAAADARRGLRRRRLRRGGPPLRAAGAPARARALPGHRLRRARARRRRRRASPPARSRTSTPVATWLERRDGPLVVDAKITPDFCAEWLEEAFK